MVVAGELLAGEGFEDATDEKEQITGTVLLFE